MNGKFKRAVGFGQQTSSQSKKEQVLDKWWQLFCILFVKRICVCANIHQPKNVSHCTKSQIFSCRYRFHLWKVECENSSKRTIKCAKKNVRSQGNEAGQRQLLTQNPRPWPNHAECRDNPAKKSANADFIHAANKNLPLIEDLLRRRAEVIAAKKNHGGQ